MIVPDICMKWIRIQRHKYKNSQQYINLIIKEFQGIEPFLPVNCKSILDIGCGVGGIDVLLYKKYKTIMHLLDGDYLSNDMLYGFNIKESIYNSLDATKKMMITNNINNYKLYNIQDGFPKLKNIDVVISIYSWGFHYTIEKYIDNVIKVLSKDGILIMDIRKSAEELYIIKTCFNNISEIETDNPKAMRICCKGKKIWK